MAVHRSIVSFPYRVHRSLLKSDKIELLFHGPTNLLIGVNLNYIVADYNDPRLLARMSAFCSKDLSIWLNLGN